MPAIATVPMSVFDHGEERTPGALAADDEVTTLAVEDPAVEDAVVPVEEAEPAAAVDVAELEEVAAGVPAVEVDVLVVAGADEDVVPAAVPAAVTAGVDPVVAGADVPVPLPVRATDAKVAVVAWPWLWLVTASPMQTLVPMGTVMTPTFVQLLPSGEQSAVKVLPARVRRTQQGLLAAAPMDQDDEPLPLPPWKANPLPAVTKAAA